MQEESFDVTSATYPGSKRRPDEVLLTRPITCNGYTIDDP